MNSSVIESLVDACNTLPTDVILGALNGLIPACIPINAEVAEKYFCELVASPCRAPLAESDVYLAAYELYIEGGPSHAYLLESGYIFRWGTTTAQCLYDQRTSIFIGDEIRGVVWDSGFILQSEPKKWCVTKNNKSVTFYKNNVAARVVFTN